MIKVKCPKCKEEIERVVLKITKIQTIYYDGKEFDEDEYSYPTETDEEWVCPECDEVLDIEDEGEATEFLEGKDELVELVDEKLNKIKEEK
ncbi:hypothetical protein LCGC14_2506220 [marine sediment metagenome]|uniref:Uncharacterized protein n=1 Tax=marine sediment metagenome TaxID=412755 RepID=A0A0F9DC79_9ZZZZ